MSVLSALIFRIYKIPGIFVFAEFYPATLTSDAHKAQCVLNDTERTDLH